MVTFEYKENLSRRNPMNWQTKEARKQLLCDLVEHPSITGSNAEIAIAEYVHHLLGQKKYFQKSPNHLLLHPLDDGRRLLTALVKSKQPTKKTVILLSHFDVVEVEDFGSLENLAFHPRALTLEMNKLYNELPIAVQEDLNGKGEWLFGRGSMDMKAGLVLHLSMLERAMEGNFDGNVLLLTVPDEEVNSLGMLTALPALERMQDDLDLEYVACMNGEPMFSKYPGDDHYYAYTGSIGKVLPGFYCYGKETHVGDPFAGLNPNLMTSFLARELELNESFIEKIDEEVTPPPVSLMQRDLKEAYSVQTPQASVAMYNVLFLKQSIDDINNKLLAGAKRACEKLDAFMQDKVKHFAEASAQFHTTYDPIRIMTYQELLEEAKLRYGAEEIERRQNLLTAQRTTGDRDFSTLLVQDLAKMCKELAPMIILFYSPPFYPAVSSHSDPYIQTVMREVKAEIENQNPLKWTVSEFFTGLSDLSFIGPLTSGDNLSQLTQNMPIQNKGFTFPDELIQKLSMPIINIGPLGRDPHQWTERVELHYSFEILPDIIEKAIHLLLSKSPTSDKHA